MEGHPQGIHAREVDGALPRAEGEDGTRMFPLFCCFHCCSGGEKAGAASGSGAPLHPTARQQHWCSFLRGGSSPFGIWVQLWFLEHSVLLGLCPRCSSSSACGFGAAATPP